jgi:hypothetical protein
MRQQKREVYLHHYLLGSFFFVRALFHGALRPINPARESLKTAKLPANLGGGKRDRTADLLHAMQALSQLSYTPRAEKRDIKEGF